MSNPTQNLRNYFQENNIYGSFHPDTIDYPIYIINYDSDVNIMHQVAGRTDKNIQESVMNHLKFKNVQFIHLNLLSGVTLKKLHTFNIPKMREIIGVEYIPESNTDCEDDNDASDLDWDSDDSEDDE